MSQVPLRMGASLEIKDLALVTITAPTNKLAVLDITDPEAVSLLTEIPILPVYGTPHEMGLRADGLLTLSTSRDVLLLDPTLLIEAGEMSDVAAAIVGVIPGAGSLGRSYVNELDGLNALSHLGQSHIVRTAPKIDFVAFPQQTQLQSSFHISALLEPNLVELFDESIRPDLVFP